MTHEAIRIEQRRSADRQAFAEGAQPLRLMGKV
jgi:hypothetical protein